MLDDDHNVGHGPCWRPACPDADFKPGGPFADAGGMRPRRLLPAALLPVLALPAGASAAAAPTAGHWRGESGASMQLAWTAKGRTLTGGRVVMPSSCGPKGVVVEQILPVLKVPASGRVTSMRRKDRGRRGYDLSLRISGGRATGTFRYFHKGFRCDTGAKPITVTAGGGAPAGRYRGTTETGEAIGFEVDRDSFGLGRVGGFGGGFAGKVETVCDGAGRIAMPVDSPTTFLRADGSFEAEHDMGEVTLSLRGRVAAAGASGTVRVRVRTGDTSCDSGTVAWTAARG